MTKSSIKAPRRPGFTLPEVLAVVTILAVLAAVVIPTVTAQIQKADPQKVGRDALSVRSGVEQFLGDVRRYPRRFDQLMAAITVSDTAMVGGIYATAEVNRWKGPYLNKGGAAGRLTGYGMTFKAAFDTATLGESLLTTGVGARYLMYAVPMDSSQATAVDVMFDDGDLTKGVFRWTTGTVSTADTLKFLIIPIQ